MNDLKAGQRVKLTPKDGGETVIYGVVHGNRDGFSTSYVLVKVDSDRGERSYDVAIWNIEPVKPTTEEILNGLGENAFVAHRTDADYYGYYKRGGKWYDADNWRTSSVKLATVAMFIDREGFEIIFEGVRDE